MHIDLRFMQNKVHIYLADKSTIRIVR